MCVKTVFKWLNGNALECVTVCPENLGFGHPSRPESGVNLGRAVSVLGRKVSQRSLKRPFLPEKGERCVKKSSKNVTTVGLLRTVGWHICRHVPYVGLGPGAHGFSPLDTSRQWNADDLQAYLDAYRNGDFSAIREGETLTREQLVLEHIMLGLRTSAGLPADYLRAHCEPAAFYRALASGDLQAVPGSERLRIPESRFFVSDSIISSLV